MTDVAADAMSLGTADDDLDRDWRALVAADPTATAFHGPTWLRAWHASLGEGDATAWVARSDDRVVGVVTHEVVDREVRFGGGTEVTDYQGPVALPAHRRDVAVAWCAHVAGLLADGAADRAVLEGLADHGPDGVTPWPQLLRTAAADAGLVVVEDAVHEVCPRVDVANGHAAWLAALDGRDRQELKRKARKLARDVGGIEVVEVAEADHDAALDRFFDMAAADPSDKGDFFRDPAMRRWFHDLRAAFAGTGVLRVHELLAAGVPAAAMVSLVHGGEWGLYNSAFDVALARLGAGMVLTGELVRVAAEEGCRVFDFLQGDESYKYQFGAVDLPLARLVLST